VMIFYYIALRPNLKDRIKRLKMDILGPNIFGFCHAYTYVVSVVPFYVSVTQEAGGV